MFIEGRRDLLIEIQRHTKALPNAPITGRGGGLIRALDPKRRASDQTGSGLVRVDVQPGLSLASAPRPRSPEVIEVNDGTRGEAIEVRPEQ